MRPELDAALVRDFPELYVDRHGDLRTTCMVWGFCCGDGWEPLIRNLSEQLTWLSKAEGVPVKAVQVKEKFGTLRFYTNGGTDIMHACIAAAERRSSHTCEVCGDFGSLRPGGGWQTLCSRHAYDAKKPIADWEANKLGVTDHVRVPAEDVD